MNTRRPSRQTIERIELQARAMRSETLSRMFADAVTTLYHACRALIAGRRQTRSA